MRGCSEDADCRDGQRAQGADHDEIRHAREFINTPSMAAGIACEILAIVSGQCRRRPKPLCFQLVT